jgi:hypothetical protein
LFTKIQRKHHDREIDGQRGPEPYFLCLVTIPKHVVNSFNVTITCGAERVALNASSG